MEVLLKGVQCSEDAVMAYKAGMNGAVLSNHGGRQLDTCRPGIEMLLEVAEALKEAGCKKGEFSLFVEICFKDLSDAYAQCEFTASDHAAVYHETVSDTYNM
eukprot:16442733-Heterocapsa_arctica.AAC.1